MTRIVGPLPPRPTTFLAPVPLVAHLGLDLTLASETFQHTGSFKFRGAYRTAQHARAPHLIAASSGNFGQALALACHLFGKRCTIVMPHDSPRVKVDAVREYGAAVDLVDTRVTPRGARVADLLAADTEAEQAFPSDGELMLVGNETLGAEIFAHAPAFDTVVAPIGGGGVIVGLLRAVQPGRRVSILAAEPVAANDVAQSFRAGRRVALPAEPETIADGVRVTGLSPANWTVVRAGCAGVLEVDEARIAEATRLLFTRANLKAEPTGALALAAVLQHGERFRGQRVCCVVTGGNVDPERYARILRGEVPV